MTKFSTTKGREDLQKASKVVKDLEDGLPDENWALEGLARQELSFKMNRQTATGFFHKGTRL